VTAMSWVGRSAALDAFAAFLQTQAPRARSWRSGVSKSGPSWLWIAQGPVGVGKSALLRRWAKMAQDAGWRVIWVDWEALRALDDRLTHPSRLALEDVLDHIYAVLRDAGLGRYFDAYEDLRRRQDQASRAVQAALQSLRQANKDESGTGLPLETLTRLGAKGLAWLVRYGLSQAGVPTTTWLPQEPLEQVLQELLQYGTDNVSRWGTWLQTWLRRQLKPEEFDLFFRPEERLLQTLAQGLRAAAERRGLVLAHDAYEIVAFLDPWLQGLWRRTGSAVIWLLASRVRLDTARRLGRWYAPGYQETWPKERLHLWTLRPWSPKETLHFVQRATSGRAFPPREVPGLVRATHGLPLAIAEAMRVWQSGAFPRIRAMGPYPSSLHPQVVERVVERILAPLAARESEIMLQRVQLLALARKPDYDLLVALWDVQEPGSVLETLEHAYGLADAEQVTLEPLVRGFLRAFLMAEGKRKRPWVREANQRALAFLQQRRAQYEIRLSTWEQRVGHARWREDTLARMHHAFWLDEDEGWMVLVEVLPAAIAHDWAFARQLVYEAGEFWPTWSASRRQQWQVLRQALVWEPDLPQARHLYFFMEQGRSHWAGLASPHESLAILAWWRGYVYYLEGHEDKAQALWAQGLKYAPAGELRERLRRLTALRDLPATMWGTLA